MFGPPSVFPPKRPDDFLPVGLPNVIRCWIAWSAFLRSVTPVIRVKEATMSAENGGCRRPGFWSHLRFDLPASLVVFLVALPLCMGVALASGMPPSAGIVTGIIG